MNAEATPRRFMPLLLKMVIVLLALFFVLVVVMTVWRVGMASGNSKRLKAIKAAGEPASAKELDAWYEAVDEKENAALVWLDGIARLNPKLEQSQQTSWSKIKIPPRGQRLSQAQLQIAAETVAAATAAAGPFAAAAVSLPIPDPLG